MEIECLWHKEPGWFLSQPGSVRTDLIAHHRVRTNPDKKTTKARRKDSVKVKTESAASFWGV